MKHLEDEDISRLIDGNLKKREREEFLSHLSRCSECFEVYSETLKFLEEDKKEQAHSAPVPQRQKESPAQGFWPWLGEFFPLKAALGAVAVMVLYTAWFILFLNVLPPREHSDIRARYVNHFLTEDEGSGVSAFSGSGSAIMASVRAGMIMRDYAELYEDWKLSETHTGLLKVLKQQCEIIEGKKGIDFTVPRRMYGDDFPFFRTRLEAFLRRQTLIEPYHLGFFIEGCILRSFSDQLPDKHELNLARRIVKNPAYQIPAGVIKDLDRLVKLDSVDKVQDICVGIKEVFLK